MVSIQLMFDRLLWVIACAIYLSPLCIHLDCPLFITLDCPACAYTIQKSAQNRLYLIDAPIEINCLLKTIHAIAPEKQNAFLEFYRKNRSHLSLKEFCREEAIALTSLKPCAQCTQIWHLQLQEILFYVMRYGISTVPFGGEKRDPEYVRSEETPPPRRTPF